jgi:DNA-binding HxlR family transcriptional regulator
MKHTHKSDKGLKYTVDIFDDKWTVLIIHELLKNPSTFCSLEKSLGSISPRTLSERLEKLQEHKIINKKIYCSHPPRYKYGLSEKGHSLSRTVNSMSAWGSRYA